MWIAAGDHGKAALGARPGARTARPGRRAARRSLARPRPRGRGAGRPQDRPGQGQRGDGDDRQGSRSPGIFRPRWRSAKATAKAAETSINQALALAPADPTLLFEAGHVAQVNGDVPGARDYWQRADRARPQGPDRQGGARGAELLPVPLTVTDRVAGPRSRDDEPAARSAEVVVDRRHHPDLLIGRGRARRAAAFARPRRRAGRPRNSPGWRS